MTLCSCKKESSSRPLGYRDITAAMQHISAFRKALVLGQATATKQGHMISFFMLSEENVELIRNTCGNGKLSQKPGFV